MAAQANTVKVFDNNQVAPPAGSVPTTTLPLTFFDIPFVYFGPPVQRIFFYELPYPTLHFTQSVFPRLRESLSLTLRHFYPLAANLACTQPLYEPSILYNEGDAVKVAIVESNDDFNYLVANHARDVKTLQSLVPKLPFISLSTSNTTHVVPVMSIQFTMFANSGLSVGVTSNHVAADGRSMNHFMKFWASIHKSPQGEDLTSSSLSLPYCSKDIIKDSDGISSIFLKDLRSIEEYSGPTGDVPDDNVLITLVLKRAKIEKLKH